MYMLMNSDNCLDIDISCWSFEFLRPVYTYVQPYDGVSTQAPLYIAYYNVITPCWYNRMYYYDICGIYWSFRIPGAHSTYKGAENINIKMHFCVIINYFLHYMYMYVHGLRRFHRVQNSKTKNLARYSIPRSRRSTVVSYSVLASHISLHYTKRDL